MKRAVAGWLLRFAAGLVPRTERRAWLEEWSAELHALDHAPTGDADSGPELPDPLRFAAGALPHAVWLRSEAWSPRGLLDDQRLALRMMGRAPAFAAGAMLTLALGIGVNGAIFSLVNGLVLRAPPGIVDAERLVQIGRVTEDPSADLAWGTFSWPNAQLVAEESNGVFRQVAGYSLAQFSVGEGPEADVVFGHFVTGSWFDLLGSTPALGRLVQPGDDQTIGGHPVMVVSHGLWMRRWGGDPDLVGRSVLLDGAPYEVIGVAPEGFVGVHTVGLRPEVFLPAVMNPGYRGDLPFGSWRWSWLNMVGRLADGADEVAAESTADLWTQRMRAAHPDNAEARVVLSPGVGVDPYSQSQTDDITRILILIVGVVLLLTCASVANLQFARATHRTPEMAVRTAMGGGRGRLARQLLVESGLLSIGATLVSVPLVLAVVNVIPGFLPLQLVSSIAPDARVWAFLLGVGGATALVCGLAPAWLAARATVAASLRDGTASAQGRRTRIRDGLVVAQLALSLGLVAGTGLLARSVMAAADADPGFESRGLRAAFVRLSFDEWNATSSVPFVEGVTQALERLPGVRSVAVGTQLPVAGGQSMASAAPSGRPDEEVQVELAAVGPGYFETLQIPMLSGRPIGDFAAEGERVAVISRDLAERFWPGEDAVGRTLAGDPEWRVVGVAEDVRMRSLRSEANPALYVPFTQAWQPGLAFAVAGAPGAAADGEGIRQAIQTVAPDIRVGIVDVRSAVLGALDDTRTIGLLVAAFAGLAVLLSGVGLYGLVAIGAARRIREFGIRVALGARPESVMRLILGRAGLLAVLGTALGVFVAVGVGRGLGALLFETSPVDPVAFAAAAVLLVGSMGVAAWLPARRAARVDAVDCLREG
ncbi:MAG: ABC transporter permease [Gemmatimonadetes bacterium]|nr:ABC transporter permease [Gemmatimonadota bacterium]